MSLQKTFRILDALFNSRYYPLVNPELDVRYRLPRKDLSKMSVLNIGVGDGYSALARQLPFVNFGELTMIDVHQPYLDSAKLKTWDAGNVHFVYADARDFPVENYDVVMMFDVLEHLPKEESLAILRKIKGLAIVFIPLETEYRANVYEVKSQEHLSIWTEQDFIDLGFKTERLVNFHHEDDRIFDALWAVKQN